VRLAARGLGRGPDLRLTGPVDGLPRPLTSEILAVVQECLSNVARHARARHTLVKVDVPAGEVVVAVSDDGIGPSGGRLRGKARGHGLSNIRDRTQALGGQADLTENRPRGCRVVWVLPLGPG